MTYKQLKNDVARLGFEALIEDEEAFLVSANRALALIYTDRPRERRVRISVTPPKPSMLCPVLEHVGGKDITVPIHGAAFSFRVSGRGSYTVCDGDIFDEYDFSDEMKEVRGLLTSNVGSIVFCGDYDYKVYSLATFDTLSGPELSDIPICKERQQISPSSKYKDFRAFASLPTDTKGKSIDGAVLSGELVYLPLSFEGELLLSYYRTHTPIVSDDENALIDISAETEYLLPLLTAAFLWLDDDADKAQYYMALYREALEEIKHYSKRCIDTKYLTNGWA